MNKILKDIFDIYKTKYKLQTSLEIKKEKDISCFNLSSNSIILYKYSTNEEFIKKNWKNKQVIWILSTGEYRNLFKNKTQFMIFSLLHELKHAIDYKRKILTGINGNVKLNFFDNRANKFALREYKKYE